MTNVIFDRGFYVTALGASASYVLEMSPAIQELLPQIKKQSLFADFSSEVLEACLREGIIKNLKHRQVLYSAGEPAERFAILTKGALKLVRPTPRGDDIIVYFATPGDVVAALIMNQGQAIYPISALAMGASQVICLPKKTFVESWSKNAALLSRINAVLYQRMTSMQEDKTQFKAPLPQRIAALLIRLLDRAAESSDPNVLSIPLTRQEIADALGAAVESVIRVMSDWNQKGIIRSADRFIEVMEVDQMLEILRDE